MVSKGDDLEKRLISFAVRIVKICAYLPRDQIGKHISGQLVRSGTAPAAHYAEARGAESAKDFVHKLRLCLKELNESRVWLLITAGSDLVSESRLREVIEECDELCRIIGASIRTASGKS